MKKQPNVKSYNWEQCQCVECTGDLESKVKPPILSFSEVATPWAIRCAIHGQVFLTNHEYNLQICSAFTLWVCPRCPEFQIGTRFDDENFDDANDQLENAMYMILSGEPKPNG